MPVNRQWKLAKSPSGMVSPDWYERTESPIPEINEGEALFRTLYLSYDPAQRGWMNKGSYMKQVVPGDVMLAQGVIRCVASKTAKFRVGDLAIGMCGWQDYVVGTGRKGDATQTRKLPPMPPGCSPTLTLSLFGTTGLTAYFGLLEVGRMKPGDTVLVSGAAGATGSIVGQIAKLKGASRVVGIAGGAAKCAYCRELGYDEVIDYKDASKSLGSRLRAACPKGFDVYFDNVGGEALEQALLLMRRHGRIALCGGISQYNPKSSRDVQGPKTYLSLIGTHSRIEGFLVMDYIKEWPRALAELAKWYQQGLVKQKEDIRSNFELIPRHFQDLFTSNNFGKLIASLEHDAEAKL